MKIEIPDHAGLAAELRRRAASAPIGDDWARRELLPAVSSGIASRPQRVAASRLPALAGLAAVLAVLALLVIAAPRSGPGSGSPRPTGEAPPSTITGMGTTAFAARLATGEFHGQTLLILGEVRVEPRPQRACAPDDLCYVGTLAGSNIDLFGRAVATPESDPESSRIETDGWPTWRRLAAPTGTTRTMAVKVDSMGTVELLGYPPAEEIAIAFSEIPYIDFDAMPLEEVRVLPAWLTGIVAPISCAPQGPEKYIAELPGRYCGNPSWLTDAPLRLDPNGFRVPDSAMQVQSGAYLEFANNPSATDGSAEPHAGAYIIGKRLEGWCDRATPPCWRWEVIGRLTLVDDGSLAQPLATPTPPMPIATPSVRYCEPVRPMSATGLPIVIDETGLIEKCQKSQAPGDDERPITISNPAGDQSILEVDWAGACADFASFTFRQVAAGFELVVVNPMPVNVYCDGLVVSHAVLLHLTQPVHADLVEASIVRGPSATLTPPPVSTPPPTAHPANIIECSDSPPDTRWPIHSTINDETDLVESCATVASSGFPAQPDTLQVENPDGDRRAIQISWLGGACDLDAQFRFARTTDGYSLGGVLASSRGPCIAVGVARAIRLQLRDDVNANEISAAWTTTSPPEPEPRTLDCPYIDPSGRPQEVSVIDHVGSVGRCETSVLSETPLEQLSVSNPPGNTSALEVQWQVNGICTFMPADLELWPPPEGAREDPDGPRYVLHVNRLAPPAGSTQGCRNAIGTQRIVLLLDESLPAESIDKFLTDGTRGTDSQDTDVGTFTLSLLAEASEYRVDEPIDVHAELVYEGPTGSVVVTGVGNLVNGFGVRQLDGPISIGPGWNEPCVPDSLTSGVARVEPYRKSGGWSEDDPLRDFYRAFFADSELRLPAGSWVITAYSEFYSGECGGELVKLTASIVIEVRGAS